MARRILRYAARSAGSASKWRMIDIETTVSSPCSLIPRTPTDERELKQEIALFSRNDANALDRYFEDISFVADLIRDELLKIEKQLEEKQDVPRR